MKSVIPTYIMIIGLCLILLVSVDLIAFQLQVSAARNYHTEVVNRIQASNGSTSVYDDILDEIGGIYECESCKKVLKSDEVNIDATTLVKSCPACGGNVKANDDKRGYVLEPRSVDEYTALYPDKKNICIKLTYTATMPFLGIEKAGTIEGFAK